MVVCRPLNDTINIIYEKVTKLFFVLLKYFLSVSYFAAKIVNSNKKSCIGDCVCYKEISADRWRNVHVEKPQGFYPIGSILFNYIGECMVHSSL
jgi:hypothetical protein